MITASDGWSFELLMNYAWRLRELRAEQHSDMFPDPVLPCVDLAAFPIANYVEPGFWADATGAPGQEAVFGAFLARCRAGFTDEEVVALMAPAAIVPNPSS